MSENELPMHQDFRKLSSDGQIDRRPRIIYQAASWVVRKYRRGRGETAVRSSTPLVLNVTRTACPKCSAGSGPAMPGSGVVCAWFCMKPDFQRYATQGNARLHGIVA